MGHAFQRADQVESFLLGLEGILTGQMALLLKEGMLKDIYQTETQHFLKV